jgi:pimeloyl-ACP methyl ester carboxylesterase
VDSVAAAKRLLVVLRRGAKRRPHGRGYHCQYGWRFVLLARPRPYRPEGVELSDPIEHDLPFSVGRIRPLRVVVAVVGVAGLAYVAACVTLAIMQRSFLYHPQPIGSFGVGNSEKLPVSDVDVVYTVQDHPGTRAVIYYGGNAENAASGLPALAQAFPDRALYALHYRGFGGSGGGPTEAALQADALALFDLVHRAHSDIVVIGRSLGSGVAIQVAAQRPLASLVLITPYYSIEELAQHQFPYFPVSWILSDKYQSWRFAPRITVPTLILTAQRDWVVPHWSTDKLFPLFQPGIASRQTIPKTDHSTITASPLYIEALRTLS